MTVESLQSPNISPPDPHQPMGLALIADQRKKRLIQMIKIGFVWLGLIAFLGSLLLLLDFDIPYIGDHYVDVLKALPITIGISLVSILIATVLALLGAIGRLSHNAIAQGISGFYVSIVRGTPLLVQIFIIYSGLPQIGTRLMAMEQLQIGSLSIPTEQIGRMFILTAIQSGILALSLNYGAYMTEIFRAGIQSISHGQREAAESIGMTRWQIMYRIILPQAVRVIIPDIGNQFIAMQKDSAQVSVMGVWEMTYMANKQSRVDSKYMEMFVIAAAFYWLLTIVSSWLEGLLERKLAHAYER
ncbi:MAG: amino acid ABC transporter permease [Anaerolineales bacterium]|jgi:polar amino acid transport system permease protein|nr:amino acid ABC transporter permease [Anaerolineales bacterium]